MSKREFVNLHLHSEYSSLDGMIRLPELTKRLKAFGQKAFALTDHGSLSGIQTAYQCAKKDGLKFIPGMEAYIVNDRTTRVKGESNKHLVLLARNEEGWHNLLKLHYEGYNSGSIMVYDRVMPRIDMNLLKQHSKGLVALTACLAGEIPRLINQGKESEAESLILTYKDMFEGNFFLEMQPWGIREHGEFVNLTGNDQRDLNNKIRDLSTRTGVRKVVTLDSHYLTAEERKAHHLLLAIQSKKTIHDPDRLFFEAIPLLPTNEVLKDFDEEESVYSTDEIAAMCQEPTYLDSSGYKLPPFQIPSGDHEYTEWKARHDEFAKDDETIQYFRYQIDKGFEQKVVKRLKHKPEEIIKYKDRLKEEYDVITSITGDGVGFAPYFLIVADLLNWCREEKIRTGVGRGSAAGCLISFLLGIVKVDPIKYDLLFSRFLNKDRVSMPDIDNDVEQARRDEVKHYISEKYGRDKVASISTFGTMKIRVAVKDIVRSLDLGGSKGDSFRLADELTKLIPDNMPDITLEEALEKIPEFKEKIDCEIEKVLDEFGTEIKQYKFQSDKPMGQIKMYADIFEGIIRQTGIHAAGVIISVDPLDKCIPTLVDKKGEVATAYDGTVLEKEGYLKLDILGLKTLSIIQKCIDNVKRTRDIDVKNMPLVGLSLTGDEDFNYKKRLFESASQQVQEATRAYELLRNGKTNAVFQLESEGMKKLLRSTKVNSIEDVSAVIALYRPGPLKSGLTAQYADRKFGNKSDAELYPYPGTKDILKNTYGVIVFQEQIMQICVKCAGLSESQADTMRKGMGKKLRDVIETFRVKFIDGYAAKYAHEGVDEEKATELWNLMEGFASYGFNKAHSISYAITGYQTAFLKANYPAEFWAGVLSYEQKEDQQIKFIKEIQTSKISILPVDVNESTLYYEAVDPQNIRRSLLSLKGVGQKAVEAILAGRPYANMADFLARVQGNRCNTKVISTLIKAGAFDDAFKSEKCKRQEYFLKYEECRKKAKKHLDKHETLEDFEFDWTLSPAEVAWTDDEIFAAEILIYGMPVSGHPLDKYKEIEDKVDTIYEERGTRVHLFEDSLSNFTKGDKVVVFGEIKALKAKRPYKTNPKKFARIYEFEDRYGKLDLTVFDQQYDTEVHRVGNVLVLQVKLDEFNGIKKLTFDRVIKKIEKLRSL